MASNEEEDSDFFEKERTRLIAEISSGFEQLLTEQNKLNQKLDQVRGVGGEFSSLAALWSNLHELMRQQELDAPVLNKSTSGGYPGSGSHVIGR
ncbi:DASH complex subunit Dad1-domain-containing protein [Cantharellus anzutake]|uniref:uncharacterized protein n=1 Tax=Cantharellus anzutake TaxID=1750568 RepID=UPI0019037252|nr:uncharacterized protein EI90DRAFT_2939051 [Cantharellus anzutake]XP_038921641.1 DASH complex subunit Dad1-domain-containing protein [Cantharellus anzutake]KAF8320980.1 hypothetical protein EI90DRAFT_2939051 [Cantharellus anzutake]KAF8340279.1 DASH complex subunit Dad1-domain-containing protein [Cantharellus anzutake]